MDILERLKAVIKGKSNDFLVEVDPEFLMQAIAEIERLRGGAGAISPGPSFQDIRETTPKVLKAFDGA